MQPFLIASYSKTRLAVLAALCLAWNPLQAGGQGSEVQYVGGTIAEIPEQAKGRLLTTHPRYLYFENKNSTIRIPFENINLLEYGQKVSRRYVLAIVVSPLLLGSKSRKHFLSIGYQDQDDQQQALVFTVDKEDIRALLVSLEARTGLKVEYQDDEARKAGKG